MYKLAICMSEVKCLLVKAVLNGILIYKNIYFYRYSISIQINYRQAPPFGYNPIGLSGHWRERCPSSLHIKHLAKSS